MIKKIYFTGILVAALVLVNVSSVTAQTASVAASPKSTTSPSLNSIQTLRDKYRSQLAAYRNDERNYDIAKEQYNQLGTLASLEEAVRSTRQVMLSRVIILRTYFDILKVQLINTKGVDLNMKNAQVQKLDASLQNLQKHQAKVEKATDRDSLLVVETEFGDFEEDLQLTSYLTSNMIAYGNLQSVYDKTRVVTNEIIDQAQKSETNALILAEKKRGFTEINRTLDGVGESLKSVKIILEKTQKDLKTGNNLSESDSQFNTIYSGIAQSLSFLDEVLKK
jgi:hypothetical protein